VAFIHRSNGEGAGRAVRKSRREKSLASISVAEIDKARCIIACRQTGTQAGKQEGVATITEEITTIRSCCGKRHKNVTDSRERSRRCIAECGTEKKRERNDGQEIDNGGGGQREREGGKEDCAPKGRVGVQGQRREGVRGGIERERERRRKRMTAGRKLAWPRVQVVTPTVIEEEEEEEEGKKGRRRKRSAAGRGGKRGGR